MAAVGGNPVPGVANGQGAVPNPAVQAPANVPNPAVQAPVNVPIPANFKDLPFKELGDLLKKRNKVPPRTKDERLKLIADEQKKDATAAGSGQSSPPTIGALLHVYRADSALAHHIAAFYGLPDLSKLPSPRWDLQMLLSPAAWPLIIQHMNYVRHDFTEVPERPAPALRALRLGIRAVFPAVEATQISQAERLLRAIAIEFLALPTTPNVHELRQFIFVDIKLQVAEATELFHGLYAEANQLPPEAQQVLDASRALSLQNLPAHMAATGAAMMRAVEKRAAQVSKRGREEGAATGGRFFCKACKGFFTDPKHKFSEAHKKNKGG